MPQTSHQLDPKPLPQNNAFMRWFKEHYPLFYQNYSADVYYQDGVCIKETGLQTITEYEQVLVKNIGHLYHHQEVLRGKHP